MNKIVIEKCPQKNLVNVYCETDREMRLIKSAPYRWRIAGQTYDFFSNGSHNLAYQSEDKRLVFKCVIDSERDDLDFPERSVRLWNLINPNFPARIAYNDVEKRKAVGWVAPFISGAQPTSADIVKKLFEIYEKTGRIVADAFVPSNSTAKPPLIAVRVNKVLP